VKRSDWNNPHKQSKSPFHVLSSSSRPFFLISVNHFITILCRGNTNSRPIRPPNGIAHGIGGGAAFNAGGRATEKDADRAGESDSDGERKERRNVGYLDDDEEGEDEDDAEREAADVVRRKEKKRQKRVVESDEEEED
jgi:hypothetical protein